MDHPVTTVLGPLSWTRSGTVWATYRISEPPAYGMRPLEDKRVVRDMHRLLFRSLSGEALLMGLAVTLDPLTVVDRQIDGIDLEAAPGVQAEAEANLERLEHMVLGDRAYYLAVPLANTGRYRWSTPLRAAAADLCDRVGYPRTRPSDEEIAMRLEQAALVQAQIPVLFRPQPATVAEQLWISAHACRRGMVDLPPPAPGSVEEELILAPLEHMRTSAALPRPVIDEGAHSDQDGPARLANPFATPVLKIFEPDQQLLGQPASYQVPMALAETPLSGLPWPGSELFQALDSIEQDVDWAIRMRVTSRDQVMARNRRALVQLDDQYQQRASEVEMSSGGRTDLDIAAQLLAEYQSELADDQLETELRHTIVLTVAGTSAEEALSRARNLKSAFAQSQFRLDIPVGDLETLWWSTQPGTPSSRVSRSYEQIATATRFASLVPMTSTRLGSSTGPVLAINRTTPRHAVVHHDLGGLPEIDSSGSIVFVGEKGGGKSVALKTVASHVIDDGGQLFAIDKSSDGEWATFARSLTDAIVCDPEQPQHSSDPLRCLGREEGSIVLRSFLSQLLDIAPNSAAGRTLGQVIDPAYLATHQLLGIQDVMTHLGTECTLSESATIGQGMRNFANLSIGRLVFDQSLPPVDGRTSAVIWRTHSMALPSRLEIETPHLFQRLTEPKVFGRAYYSLVLGLARYWGFSDRSRTTLFGADEAYDITGNPENAGHLEHINRQGRRGKFALGMGSHDPDNDFGDRALRELIPTRVIMRHRSDQLARASVKYVGIDEDDPEYEALVKEIREDTSPIVDGGVPAERRGEGIMRDAFGHIGRIRILPPAVPERAQATLSTPPKRASRR